MEANSVDSDNNGNAKSNPQQTISDWPNLHTMTFH